ncbi:MAG: hypothetical protein ACLFP6_08645 [Spirochaetaceae bacterium]
MLLAVEPRIAAQIEVDEPRVLLLPFVNQTDREQNSVVAATTTDTIALTLRLLDGYQLVEAEELTSADLLELGPDALAELAAQEEVDNIIYGSISESPAGGGISFLLRVYDRAEDDVTLETIAEAASILEVFEASDRLVAEAVSGFSGVRVGFGSLALSPEGEGEFNLYIDDSLVGANLASVEQVLIGERTVEVRQLRGGQEVTIFRDVVEIEEGGRVSLTFGFPEVTEDELLAEATLREEFMLEAVSGADLAGMSSRIDALAALYERLPGALPGSSRDLRFYEERLFLAEEMQRLSQLDLPSLARLPRDAQEDRVAALMAPWFEIHASQEGYETDLYPLEYRLDRIERDIERNQGVLQALVSIERSAVTEREQYELVADYNRLWVVVSAQEFQAPLYLRKPRERLLATRYLGEYESALRRRTPFWHWVAGTVGLGGLGYAAYVQFFGDLPDLDSRIEENISRYEASTDFDEIRSLRSEITDDEQRYNTIQTFAVIGAAGGTALVSTAVIGRIVSLTRPRRVWRRYRREPLIARTTAAGLDYLERPAEGDEGAGVIILGENESFTATGVNGVLRTPQYIEVEAGQEFELIHETAGREQRERYTVLPTSGVTIIPLGGDNDVGPR